MHLLLIILMAIMVIAGSIVAVGVSLDKNLTPVFRVSGTVLVLVIAALIAGGTYHSTIYPPDYSAFDAPPAQNIAREDQAQPAYYAPPSGADVQRVVPASAVTVAPSSGGNDMLLGGVLGYALGSSGRSAAPPVATTSTVIHQTTINNTRPVTVTRAAALKPSAPVASTGLRATLSASRSTGFAPRR